MFKNDLVCVEAVNSKSPTSEELPYIFVNEFNDKATNDFYKAFMNLNAKTEIKIIPIVISTYGGEVYSLLSMLDIIKFSKKPVATVALGKAMSCGVTLLASGTKGNRYVSPNADVMIHEVAHVEWGKLADTTNGVNQATKLNNRIFSLLEGFTGAKKGTFQKRMKELNNVDWFLTASECKALGIVDFVGIPTLLKI